MNQSNSLAIILAAGKGTRMNQKVPKPLVKVYQRPIISWIIDSFKINNIDIAVIINPKQESFFEEYNNETKFIYQKNQRGTGHAVMQASNIIKHYKYVYVFVGDSPFVGQEIIASMYHEHISTNSDVTILSSIFGSGSPSFINSKDKLCSNLFCSIRQFAISVTFIAFILGTAILP